MDNMYINNEFIEFQHKYNKIQHYRDFALYQIFQSHELHIMKMNDKSSGHITFKDQCPNVIT